MAISIGLISSGLSLITAILTRIWKEEESVGKTGSAKHEYVKGFFSAYLEEHGLVLSDIDGFIDGLIALFNKHDIFSKEGR